MKVKLLKKNLPRLCAPGHVHPTQLRQKNSRDMCRLSTIATVENNLKEQRGLQRSSIFFTNASQIYFWKLIKSLARLWAQKGWLQGVKRSPVFFMSWH